MAEDQPIERVTALMALMAMIAYSSPQSSTDDSRPFPPLPGRIPVAHKKLSTFFEDLEDEQKVNMSVILCTGMLN